MNPHDARDLIAAALATIAPEVDLADFPPETRLRDDLDLDSMDFLALLETLGERTGVEIPESDYAQLDTVQRLTDYLAARLPTAAT